jgi:hypothetical protein
MTSCASLRVVSVCSRRHGRRLWRGFLRFPGGYLALSVSNAKTIPRYHESTER